MRTVGLIFGLPGPMRLSSLAAFLSIAATALGQGRERIFETDSGTVVIHYFTTGEVSTREWMDKDDRWGRTWAYKQDGTVLLDNQTRRIAGHASVHFEYHANGAISKAEYSDAPDAGIQWYRSTTTYDDQGNQTGFTEQGHDNYDIIPHPGVRVTPKPEVVTPPLMQEVVNEQRMFVNELFVVNPTRWTCQVYVSVKDPSPAMPGGTFTIGPRDTLRIGAYSPGELFEEPEGHLSIAVSRKLRKTGFYKMAHYKLSTTEVSPEHRRYYRTVNGWFSTRKIW